MGSLICFVLPALMTITVTTVAQTKQKYQAQVSETFLLVSSVCDLCVWSLCVVFVCDLCVWSLCVVFVCGLCVWSLYQAQVSETFLLVSFVCDLYVWSICVVLVPGTGQ